MKKTLCLLLCILLLVGACVALFYACKPAEKQKEETEQQPQKTRVLFLGDSIGEGVAGVSPLTEREAYAYYGILGNANDFAYRNRAVSGYTTSNLAEYVTREDDGLNMVRSLITAADVIHVSIIGNDFLNSNHDRMVLALARDDYSDIEWREERAKTKITQVLTTIRSYNPGATVLVQTLYNPAGENSALFSSFARTQLAAMGVEPKEYHALLDKLVQRMNAVIRSCLTDLTVTNDAGESVAPFELVEVYEAMESIYREDPTRWARLITGDGIHPSNEGHAVIAATIQRKLEDLGIASPNALKGYKTQKITQLSRLFGDLPDLDAVREKINAATDFTGVSNAYFDGVAGMVPHYATKPTKTGTTFEEDKNFTIDLAKVFGKDLTFMLEESQSSVFFGADGTYRLTLTMTSLVSGGLALAIQSAGSIDFDDYYPIEVLLPYFRDIAPGVEPTDLKGLVQALKEIYEIEIDAVNFEKKATKDLLRTFSESGKLIVSDPAVLKDPIRITFGGNYRLEEVTNPVTNEKVMVIYVNNPIGQNESYVRYTLRENEGDLYIRFLLDVAKTELEGSCYAEA